MFFLASFCLDFNVLDSNFKQYGTIIKLWLVLNGTDVLEVI